MRTANQARCAHALCRVDRHEQRALWFFAESCRYYGQASIEVHQICRLRSSTLMDVSPQKLQLHVRAACCLNHLLGALAWCPRLRELDLCLHHKESDEDEDDVCGVHMVADAPAFADLTALQRLQVLKGISWGDMVCSEPVRYCCLARLAGNLAPLTGLTELTVRIHQAAVVPAALAQLKALQKLDFDGFDPCVLEAGCLRLPSLQSLWFRGCKFADADELLRDVTALRSLSSLSFFGHGPQFFDPRLLQLPHLQLAAWTGPRAQATSFTRLSHAARPSCQLTWARSAQP